MDVIRSTLQPVTHALPDPIRDLGLSLIGPDCYKSLILDIDITNTTCLKLALSKSLGIATVAGSSIVKLPQILKLVSSQSASGISFLSYALETSAFIITLAYSARSGFPFSTYGETAMIAAQNVVISLLVLRFDGRTVLATGFLGALLAGGWALFNEQAVDMGTLGYAQMGAGLLGVASKAPQIWTIYKQGGTGQLSAFAVFNFLFGSLTRIFTTIQEVNDPLILYGYIAGFLLNAVLAFQMVSQDCRKKRRIIVGLREDVNVDIDKVYYWKSPATAPHAAEAGKKPEKIAMGSSTSTSTKKPTTRRRG